MLHSNKKIIKNKVSSIHLVQELGNTSKEGMVISPSGVRSVWLRNNLANKKQLKNFLKKVPTFT